MCVYHIVAGIVLMQLRHSLRVQQDRYYALASELVTLRTSRSHRREKGSDWWGRGGKPVCHSVCIPSAA